MHNSVEGKSGPVGSYQLQAVLIALCLAQLHVHVNAVLGRIDLLTVMMSHDESWRWRKQGVLAGNLMILLTRSTVALLC